MSRIGVRGALLAAFLTASGAPLVIFWLWPHSAMLRNEVEAVRDRHLLLADNIGSALQRYHRDLTLGFRTVAPLVARGEDTRFAYEMLKALSFRHICVADPDTGVVKQAVLTERAPCPAVVPAERLAMFREMTRDGAVRLSDVMTPPDGGPPRLFIAERTPDGLVVGAVGLEYFSEIAGRVAFGRSGHATILDAKGRVLAHPRADWVAEARDLSRLAPVQRMMQGETGVMTFHSPALDTEVIAGFTTVPEAGWGIMIPQPLSELRDKAEGVADSAALVMLAGLSLSAAIALIFSAHVARGVGRVTAAALRMARGEEGVRLKPGAMHFALAEIAQLGESFNAMAQRVDDARDRVAALARADRLTGLLNRGAFLEEAQRRLNAAPPGHPGFALFFVDVDRFKAINDGYGHAIGDALLREVAARLTTAAPGALVARQSGDEFLLLHERGGPVGCKVIGARILEALAEPVGVEGRRFVISGSIGASVWPGDASDLDALIANADHAMYEAKLKGRNALLFFDGAMRKRLEENERLTRALQEGLGTGAVRTVFQPILSARTGALVGFEALARWTAPGLGPVPPERFVALAEEAGLIAELGRQVRRNAFAFAAALAHRGRGLRMAVNVSQSELAQHGFGRELADALDEVGLPHGLVILEITESLLDEQRGPRAEDLTALRRLGVSLALDDFGKGFSSHGRLRSYPVDRLKIDLGFIGDIVADKAARAVAKSLLKLGRSLEMTVTVEGVETADEHEMIVKLGADEVQGFWHHQPLEQEAAMALALSAPVAERPARSA